MTDAQPLKDTDMIDFQALRPAGQTAADIRAALFKTNVACGEAAAAIADARSARDDMLLVGSADALSAAETRLAEAVTNGVRLNSMHERLQRMAATAPAQAPTRLQQQIDAVTAIARFADWWRVQGPGLCQEITTGLTLMSDAAASAALLAQSETAARPQSATGIVVPLTTPRTSA